MRHGWTELVDLVRLGRGIEALTADRYDEAWVQLRQLIDFPAASIGMGQAARRRLPGGDRVALRK